MGKAKRIKQKHKTEQENVLAKAKWDNVRELVTDCRAAVVTAAAGSKALIDNARVGGKELPADAANDIIELSRSIQSIESDIKRIDECTPAGSEVVDVNNYPTYLSLMDQATDVFVRVTNEIAPRIQTLTQTLLTEEELNNV